MIEYDKIYIKTKDWICHNEYTRTTIHCCGKEEFTENNNRCDRAEGEISFSDGRRGYNTKWMFRDDSVGLKCFDDEGDKICSMAKDLDKMDNWRDPSADRLSKEPTRKCRDYACL